MKLLVSDFDGTFYLDDNSIKKNIEKINNWLDDGNLFMLSSGRSFTSLKKMAKKYNINYDYLSCCDGSILYDKFDNIIVKYDLNNNILDEFLNLTKLVKIEKIQYSYPDDYYPEYNGNVLIGCNIVIDNNEINDSFLNEFKNLSEKHLDYDFLCYKHDDVTFFCLKNKDINKSTTINFLKDTLNIKIKNIYTFGDNENDYYMLKYFNGYHIGKVSDRIKEVTLKGYNQVYEFFDDIEKLSN